ncbi:hypothetical protein PS9374_02969 [Planomonospora sphaerica]|uniref:Uncharacterized protein n=1 Tax=Planomonospora sphaerica TaxID=161355 RepID=A0A171CW85_9ACTN|nr:hypothetical protein PS9374_02969 [Planomonospora sphaerica]
MRPHPRHADATDVRDLFRAPALLQSRLDEVAQYLALVDSPGLGPRPTHLRPLLSGERAVIRRVAWLDVGVAVPPDLPTDGRRAAAQLGRDRPNGSLLPPQVCDADALFLGKVARRRGRPRPLCTEGAGKVAASICCEGPDGRPRSLACPLRGLRALTAPIHPLLSGSSVSADNATGFPDAHTLANELKELSSRLNQRSTWCCSENHRVPGVRVLRRSLEPKLAPGGASQGSVSRRGRLRRPGARQPSDRGSRGKVEDRAYDARCCAY